MDQPAAIGSQFDEYAKWHHTDDDTDDLVALLEFLLGRHRGHHGRWLARLVTVAKRIAQPTDKLIDTVWTDLPFLDALVDFSFLRTRPFDKLRGLRGRFR